MKIRIDFNNEERDELLATFSKKESKKIFQTITWLLENLVPLQVILNKIM